jgi:hypothetical protein
MHAMHKNEAGFALATAILALVVVGALVTAGFFAASQEGQVGTSNAQADLAFYIAEQGVQNTLGTVRKREVRDLVAGETLDREGTVAVGGRTVGNYTASIRPFGGEFFFIESVGTVTQGGRYAGATRRVGMVVRTMELRFPMSAALTSFGGINLRGRATISGTDTPPGVWADSLCDEPLATEAGIRTTPDSEIDTTGNVRISGDPRIQYDPTLTPDEFSDFGDVDLAELRSMATHLVAGGDFVPGPTFRADGTCDTGNVQNWGDPTAAPETDCSRHFPIIYSEGSMSMRGNGVGQGILIVEGDLSVVGTFQFYGIVIVTGVFNNQSGSGNAQIHGTLLTASNTQIDHQSEFGGTPVIQFSTCSVTRAMQENDAVSRLFPVQKRSWVDLTAAGVEG